MNEFTYEILPDFHNVILRSDGAWIPMDEGNTDYQAYLASQKEEK